MFKNRFVLSLGVAISLLLVTVLAVSQSFSKLPTVQWI